MDYLILIYKVILYSNEFFGFVLFDINILRNFMLTFITDVGSIIKLPYFVVSLLKVGFTVCFIYHLKQTLMPTKQNDVTVIFVDDYVKILLPQFCLDKFMLATSNEATADDTLSCSYSHVFNCVSNLATVLLSFSEICISYK